MYIVLANPFFQAQGWQSRMLVLACPEVLTYASMRVMCVSKLAWWNEYSDMKIGRHRREKEELSFSSLFCHSIFTSQYSLLHAHFTCTSSSCWHSSTLPDPPAPRTEQGKYNLCYCLHVSLLLGRILPSNLYVLHCSVKIVLTLCVVGSCSECWLSTLLQF